MLLRKNTIDISVKFIQSAKTSSIENFHDYKPKITSNPRKQIENLSQSNKKIIKSVKRERFGLKK